MAAKKTPKEPKELISCTPKRLPTDILVEARAQACLAYPPNEVSPEVYGWLSPEEAKDPGRIASMRGSYWGPTGASDLAVYFMDTKSAALINAILEHANAWSQYGNVRFRQTNDRGAPIRVARTPGQGYYSYLGRDCLSIPLNQPTLNLDSFTVNTALSEYKRVVRHEFGHALSYPHEHQLKEIVDRIDPQKAIAYFRRFDGWDEQTVRQQVLTSLDERSLLGRTAIDGQSIMAYQLEAAIMKDGIAVPGGMDIDMLDGAFTAKIYPKTDVPPPPPPPGPVSGDVVVVGPDGATTFTLRSGQKYKIVAA